MATGKSRADLGRRARQRGRGGERLAVFWLRLKGYRILERNFRTAVGEIDIVARRGRTICAVEVKARDEIVTALDAVTLRQQRRIARAVLAFLQQNPAYLGFNVRFDAVFVQPWRLPRHFQAAWHFDG